MNKKTLVPLFAMLAVLLMVVAADAQSLNGNMMKAKVPFSFMVNQKEMPAGDYTVKLVGSGPRYLVISDERGNLTTALPNGVLASRVSKKATLVFHRYGDRYFLSQVWGQGQDLGHELPQSKREKEILAQSQRKDEVVVASK